MSAATERLEAGLFFRWVEQYLVGPMAALGYAPIHEPANGRRFDDGFEAGGEAPKQRLGPDDPETQDEWWLSYEPATELLDLGEWEPVAGDRVDRDIWREHGPCCRRLRP